MAGKLSEVALETLSAKVDINKIIQEASDFIEEKYGDAIDGRLMEEAFHQVLQKDEVADLVVTGIFLDDQATALPDGHPLKDRLTKDSNGYNVDEILAIGIAQTFSAGTTVHYGWFDNQGSPLLDSIDGAQGVVNVFLDDLVAALIAATGTMYIQLRGGNNY